MQLDLENVVIRPGTLDGSIFEHVVQGNEYRLPETFAPDHLVIDIGAHIGCFSLAACIRGSRRIFAVEAHRTNFGLALMNLKPALKNGDVRLLFGAVWRSDTNDDVLRCGPFPLWGNLVNTGGACVTPEGSEEATIPKFALDTLLLDATQGGRTRVRLLKLDCEGSEWPILLTARRLDLVEEIVGEFHEFGGRHDRLRLPVHIDGYRRFTADILRNVLRGAGFDVEIRRNSDYRSRGLFRARR